MLAVLAAACGADDDSVPPACTVDANCGERASCIAGACVPDTALVLGAPCVSDDECEDGACVDSVCARPCPRESVCPDGFACRIVVEHADSDGVPDAAATWCLAENAADAEKGASCASDVDCRTGICHLGVCAEVCDSTEACGSGFACDDVAAYPGGVAPFPNGCPATFDAAAHVTLCLPDQVLLDVQLGAAANDAAFVLDVPPRAASFMLVVEDSAGSFVGVKSLRGPGGSTLYDLALGLGSPIWYLQDTRISAMLVPNTPDIAWSPGTHCASFYAPAVAEVDVQALLKLSPTGDVTSGVLDLNFYVMNLGGMPCGVDDLNATSAPSHPVLQNAIDGMRGIYGQMGVSIGTITYHDRSTYPALDVVDGNDQQELAQLFALATDSSGYSVDVFLMRALGGVVGTASVVTGPAGKHTIPHAGVAVNAQADCLSASLASLLAHEIGHHLGMFHIDADPIADTTTDPTNFMSQTAEGTIASAGQGFVLRRHPNVKSSN